MTIKRQAFKKTIFPNLTGLRFLAFSWIFLFHLMHNNTLLTNASGFLYYLNSFIQKGNLAFDVFFVLSGFLISKNILEEINHAGKFNLARFVIYRTLRIWPLYFLVIAILYLALPVLSGALHKSLTLPPVWPLLTFTSNFFYLNHGDNYFSPAVIIWSISVEEQFYILWGLLFYLFFRRPVWIMIVAATAYAILYIIKGGALEHFNSITYIPHFVFGTALAYLYTNKKEILLSFKGLANISIPVTYILIILTISWFENLPGQWSRPVLAFLCTLVIYDQGINEKRWFNLGKPEILKYLGTISYGLFCYHGFVIVLFLVLGRSYGVLNSWWFLPIAAILLMIITIIISHISYYLFEKKFLDMRKRV